MHYELPTQRGVMKSGFLVLADGTVYSRQKLSPEGTPIDLVRRDLEADHADLATDNASTDERLIPLLAKVDRTKGMWLVGTGRNTPLYERLGDVYGTLDYATGISFDFTMQIKDDDAADRIEERVADAKQSGGVVGGAIAETLQALTFQRSGDTFHLALTLQPKQVTALYEQLAPLMGN